MIILLILSLLLLSLHLLLHLLLVLDLLMVFGTYLLLNIHIVFRWSSFLFGGSNDQMWWRAWRVHWSSVQITDEIRSSWLIVRIRHIMVNRAWSIGACSSIIRRMTSAVSWLLTITILPRGHDNILNVVVDWKVDCWFLHFNFLIGTDQRGFGLLLWNWGWSMVIWVGGSVNKIAYFWSMVIVMITGCSMSMMDSSMRLTRILEMITTSRLS